MSKWVPPGFAMEGERGRGHAENLFTNLHASHEGFLEYFLRCFNFWCKYLYIFIFFNSHFLQKIRGELSVKFVQNAAPNIMNFNTEILYLDIFIR
jgi:hypothetical protein